MEREGRRNTCRGLSYSPQSRHLPQCRAADQPGLHPIVFSEEIEDSALAQLLLCLKKPRPDGKPITRAETRECLNISHAALAEIETWVIELEYHLAECYEDLAQTQAQNISISESLLREGPICPAELQGFYRLLPAPEFSPIQPTRPVEL